MEIGAELYYYAFEDLGSCRYYELGEIPWVAIQAYCNEYEFEGDQRALMFEVIRRVDLWYLVRNQELADKKADHGQKTLGGKKRKGSKESVPRAVGTR